MIPSPDPRATAKTVQEKWPVVCPLCDTRNVEGCTLCEECGHNPQVRRGDDDCYSCRVLGYAKPGPVNG